MEGAVLKCGSPSIRYEVFRIDGWVRLAEGLIEKIGGGDGHLRQRLWDKVLVIRTGEEGEIARQTVEGVRRGKGGNG
jgi:hypothetical protein